MIISAASGKKLLAGMLGLSSAMISIAGQAGETRSRHSTGYLQLNHAADSAAGLWYQLADPYHQDWLTSFSEPGDEISRSTLTLDQRLGDATLHYGLADSHDQTLNQLGLTKDAFSVYGYSGSGDTTSSIAHAFNAIEPFHFHGGLRSDYQFGGLHIGYQLSNNTGLGFSRTTIRAPGLETRSVSAFEWSGRNASITFMEVRSNGERSGGATSAATSVFGLTLGANYLRAENRATYSGLFLQGQSRGGAKWELRAEQRRNPLYHAANDDRLVFKLGFDIRTIPRFNAEQPTTNDAEQQDDGVEKNKGNGLLIGAGAVGVGVAMSSGGGSSVDDRARFDSQNSAAFDVLNDVNPRSVQQNLEWGGYVYRNADGTFSSTPPIRGQAASVSLPNPRAVAPAGGATTATYHTHAGYDPRYDNENFSPQDLITDIKFGLDGYLATPAGRFKLHDISEGTVITLGGPNTIANTLPE